MTNTKIQCIFFVYNSGLLAYRQLPSFPGKQHKQFLTEEEKESFIAEHTATDPIQQDTTDEVIKPARLHHVNLKAVKFEEMHAFYTALIGIHPIAEIGIPTIAPTTAWR